MGGTGISQVFPFNRIEKAFLACVRSNVAHVDGHVMHLDARDSLNLSVYGAFEPFESEIIKSKVKPGDSVIDVGANIGYCTLLLARSVGTEGTVFAFEPDPYNFALLEKNIAANGYTNVVAVQAAVSNEAGVARLFLSPSDHVDHRLYPSDGAREAVEVPCIRLDDYFADSDRTFAFIKMDIQGCEGKAIQGMKTLLTRNVNIRIVTEFWPWGLHHADVDPCAYLHALQEHGFRIFEIDERTEKVIPAIPGDLLVRFTVKNNQFSNLLCEKGFGEGLVS